ncbi:hypothetical protein [Thermospira aquatica]|uniref:Uncharacterized protein n=1 Tax=Thermospira aquatica TaxID=2828656 RepID=A0AAX3BGF2_9SPIR|nr:hypothetical protein [Thermospira aquatica]URA11109.1 hypothetical protein KDW03_04750 [Thermospira aquatica]
MLFTSPGGNVFWNGGGPIDTIFGVFSEEKGKSLVGVGTNMAGVPELFFLDENGGDSGIPSLRLTITPFISYGIRRGERVYVFVSISAGISRLYSFIQGEWRGGALYFCVDKFQALNVVVYEDLVVVAYVTEPRKIVVKMYQDTSTGLRELSAKTLETPEDKGYIEAIDFFHDKAGEKIILGVFHGLDGETKVGVSYYTLRL